SVEEIVQVFERLCRRVEPRQENRLGLWVSAALRAEQVDTKGLSTDLERCRRLLGVERRNWQEAHLQAVQDLGYVELGMGNGHVDVRFGCSREVHVLSPE